MPPHAHVVLSLTHTSSHSRRPQDVRLLHSLLRRDPQPEDQGLGRDQPRLLARAITKARGGGDDDHLLGQAPPVYEDAQAALDTGISDLSSISAEDRKRLKEDTSLLTTGATLELQKDKIGADVRNNLTKIAMEQLKLGSAEAREIAKQVITANPFLIQDYTRETDPIKKAMLADQLTAAMAVTKSSLDQIKNGIVAGATDSFDQSKFINTIFISPL